MRSDGRLAGFAALVTGASRGIGLGIAREFAKEGADLLLVATSEERLASAGQALVGEGVRVETLAADIGERASCQRAVAQAVELFGKLDILVNAAAMYKAAPFLRYAPADFERVLQVNLHGPIHMMQAALPHMLERRYGRIINVASTAGKWASANQSAYNISKHGLVGLTRCTAMEFAAHGDSGVFLHELVRQIRLHHAWTYRIDRDALNDATRAFGKRFAARDQGRKPTSVQIGVYSAVLHYLEAVAAAGSLDRNAIATKMRELPVNDAFVKNGKVRADGLMQHDIYLLQLKKPSDANKDPWDLFNVVRTIPADVAFRPIERSECPLLKR